MLSYHDLFFLTLARLRSFCANELIAEKTIIEKAKRENLRIRLILSVFNVTLFTLMSYYFNINDSKINTKLILTNRLTD
jgi:hypothetical protein